MWSSRLILRSGSSFGLGESNRPFPWMNSRSGLAVRQSPNARPSIRVFVQLLGGCKGTRVACCRVPCFRFPSSPTPRPPCLPAPRPSRRHGPRFVRPTDDRGPQTAASCSLLLASCLLPAACCPPVPFLLLAAGCLLPAGSSVCCLLQAATCQLALTGLEHAIGHSSLCG